MPKITFFLAGIFVAFTLHFSSASEFDRRQCAEMAGDTIDRSGRYCLTSDLDHGIRIDTDDVVLDFSGHCLNGDGNRTKVSAGIYIPAGRRRIRIESGCIDGFMYGVLADDGVNVNRSSHIAIHGMVIKNNMFRGIMLFSDHASVVNSVVSNTGGTAFFPDAYAMAIEIRGSDCVVRDNIMREFYPVGSGEGVGLSISDLDTPRCSITGNLAQNDRLLDIGRTFGFWISSPATFKHNVALNMTYGIVLPYNQRASDTANNLLAEQCQGRFYSLAAKRPTNLASDTVFMQYVHPQCPDHLDVARRCLRPSLRKNSAAALYRMGIVYRMNQKAEIALKYFRAAAARGHSESQRILDKRTKSQSSAKRSKTSAGH